MLQKVQKYSKVHGRIHTDTPILLAVSGGIDSVVMVELMQQMQQKFGIAHCNFQLRGEESDGDALFVKKLAEKYQVPYFEISFDTEKSAKEPGGSIQMAARTLRYDWLEKIRKENGFHVIATAHHQNDLMETMLYNLTKGTGIAGVHGILPKNGYLVRPMLCLTKEEIVDFAAKENLTCREDASNASTKYARNKIRHKVVPILKELNPKVENTFFENAQRLRETELVYQWGVEQQRKKLLEKKRNDFFISILKVKKSLAPSTLLWEILRPFGFNNSQVQEILEIIDGPSGKLFYSETHRLVKDRKFLIISLLEQEVPTFLILEVDTRKVLLAPYKLHVDVKKIENYAVENNPKVAALDLEKLVFPLKLRKWEAGDYFYPMGMFKENGKAGKKKLKAYFANQKMSLVEKEQLWILQDNKDRIVWLVGERIDDRFKVTPSTKKIYRLRMKQGK